MKNFRLFALVLGLLIAAVVVHKVHRNHLRDQAQRDEATSELKVNTIEESISKRIEKQVKKNTQQKIESVSHSLEKDGHLEKLLGLDPIGKLAQQILKDSLAKKSRQPASVASGPSCKTQNDCPYKLQQFYTEVLNRIPITAESASVKSLMQENMLTSDLPNDIKQNLLLSDLTSPDFRSITPTSGRDENGKPYLGPESMFLLTTENRLMQLNPNPQMAINATLTAISNSQDGLGQMLATLSLLGHYPKMQSAYLPQLNQLGISPQSISAASGLPLVKQGAGH